MPSAQELSGLLCRICGNSRENSVFVAREMMLGLSHEFRYVECHSCGCLQILDPPNDWTPYYPKDYYSYAFAPDSAFRRFLKGCRARYALGQRNLVGAILARRWGSPPFAQWVRIAGVKPDDAVLDVGSGTGQVLLEMKQAGFSNLTGADPYIANDLTLGAGARVLRKHIHEIQGQFDFVMMNHSFEHMEDPQKTLSEVARLLRPGRVLLIRIPVAGTYAWREYGPAWVQFDAPRHVFLHTENSLRLLAEKSGFVIREAHYDSSGFQFWGSEQYRQGISLCDDRSYAINPANSIFTDEQIAAFERKAQELNQRHDGDQACFYMVRQ